MDRKRSLVRNALSGWAVLAVSLPATLVVTPFIVNALDTEMYGVWAWLNGLLMYTDLLYFGLGSAIIKNVAHYRAKQDLPAIGRLVSVVTFIYGVIGLGCLVALLWLGTRLPGLLAEPLSPVAASQTAITCALLGVQVFLVFVGSAFAGLICGHDRFDLVNGVTVVSLLLRSAGTFLLVESGHRAMVHLAVVTSATAAIQTAALLMISLRLLRGVSIRPTRPTRVELQHLYGFGFQSFFVVFAVRLISNTDVMVIGLMLGATSVSLYNLPLQLLEQARSAIGAVTTVLLPSVAGLAADNNMAAIREFYIRTMRVTSFMAGWILSLGMVLGPAFLDRWVGPEFGAPVQWVLVFLAITMFFQNLTVHAPLAFYQALHLLRWPAMVLVAEALMNLALSIKLAPGLGINGVALATVLPALLLSTVILPPYLCRKLDLPFGRFLAEAVGPGVLALVTSTAVALASGLAIDSRSYFGIAARALATVPFVLIVFTATFPRAQQQKLWRLVGLARSR